jgi:hypothetical protein
LKRVLPAAGAYIHAFLNGAGKGVFVFECDDAMVMAKIVQDWSVLLTFDVFPVLDDEGSLRRAAM